MSTYRSKHKHSLLVERIADVELRQGARLKRKGVLYRRLDQDEGLTVRPIEEFESKFGEVEPSIRIDRKSLANALKSMPLPEEE